MSYTKKDQTIYIGDTWHISDGEKVQAFFLQYKQEDAPPEGKEYGAIGRAESKDMIVWDTLPSAIYPGEVGAYDDKDIWTGCTVEKDGKYYLFYTSRSSGMTSASISVAISNDGKNYQKYEGNPLFTPDEKFYVGQNSPLHVVHHGNIYFDSYDVRDLCVVKDEEKKCYWGFFAARRRADEVAETSVIGLARSYDLLHWEQFPPCFVPNRYHCIETPDVFFMNGKWYMLCLAGNIYGQRRYGKEKLQYPRITIYGIADRLEGPYKEPEDNLLVATLGVDALCAKTVVHKGKRYLFYTEMCQGEGAKELAFMSLPKEVKCRNGKLYTAYYPAIENYCKENIHLTFDDIIKSEGEYGTIGQWLEKDGYICGETRSDWAILPFTKYAENFIFESDIENISAEEVGLVFGVSDNIAFGAHAVLLDYVKKTVVQTRLRAFFTAEEREWKFKKKLNLKLVVVGMTTDVYIDDVHIMHSLTYGNAGKVGLFVEKGLVKFKNVRLQILDNLENN